LGKQFSLEIFEYKESFRLATSTAYKNYREQLAKHEGVQLERRDVSYFLNYSIHGHEICV
jgi:hypothetical protein